MMLLLLSTNNHIYDREIVRFDCDSSCGDSDCVDYLLREANDKQSNQLLVDTC